MALLASLSTKGKLTLAGCALAFLAAAFMIMKVAGAPSYTTIQSGIDPTKSGQITSALGAAGVSYELQQAGTAVAVKKGQESEAEIALASKGLNSTSTQPGFEILDKQKLGASTQQQQVAYLRGLEGEIANTVSQIDGAQGATVNLTLSQDNLFTSESQPATAAVLIPGDGSVLGAGAVRGIANLVASSVPMLKASAVTITDGSGAMLWPSGDGSGDTGGVPAKAAAEARYNQQQAASLQAMLNQTLGVGMAQVQVHSDLDVDKTTQQSLTYDKKSAVPLSQKKATEALTGSGAAAAAGAAGTASNLPSYGTTGTSTTSGANNNYKNTTTDTTFGVDKTVANTVKAPGTINSQQVSVLLNSNIKPALTPATVKSLTKSLDAAAGIQAKRGDLLNVTSLPFATVAKAQPVATSLVPPAFAGILKGAGLGFGALLFLFFVSRHLKRREREQLADEPSWLRQLEDPNGPRAGMAQLEGAPTEATAVIATSDPRRRALDSIIDEQPDRVAAHLRGWITEDAQ